MNEAVRVLLSVSCPLPYVSQDLVESFKSVGLLVEVETTTWVVELEKFPSDLNRAQDMELALLCLLKMLDC